MARVCRGNAEGMWAQLLVFVPCLVWNAVFVCLGLWLQPAFLRSESAWRQAACCLCPAATCFQLHIKGVFGV